MLSLAALGVPDQKANDVIRVDSSKYILHYRIIGVRDSILENIKTRLKFQQARIKNPTYADIQQLYQVGPEEITKAVQPYGYFHPIIKSKLIKQKRQWVAIYYLSLNIPMKIINLDLKITGDGANDRSFKKFKIRFPLQTQGILDTTKYNQAKQDFFDLASRRGYIAAKITQNEILINQATNTAKVMLYLDTGPRYHFGQVEFSSTTFKRQFLERFLAFKEGEYFSSNKLHLTQEQLGSSNLFQNVTVEPQFEKVSNLTVPIEIHLIPHNSQQYNIGIGYGTDTGVRALFGLDLYNLTTNGQHFNGVIKATTKKEIDLEAHYIIPGLNPLTDQFDLSVGTEYDDESFGKDWTTKGGPGYTTNLWGWQQILRVDVQHEGWEFNDQSYQQATLVVPNITWLKNKVNDPIHPTEGYRLNIFLEYPFDISGASFDFGKLRVDGKIMYPIPRGPILVLRGALGLLDVRGDNLTSLPLSFWFASGGAESIRGYPYNEIGPGTELIEGTVELRQKLTDDIYGTIFYDLGNAGNAIFTSENPPFAHRSPGLGLVWMSPIGSMRLSYARATDQPDSPQRIQFSMGMEL